MPRRRAPPRGPAHRVRAGRGPVRLQRQRPRGCARSSRARASLAVVVKRSSSLVRREPTGDSIRRTGCARWSAAATEAHVDPVVAALRRCWSGKPLRRRSGTRRCRRRAPLASARSGPGSRRRPSKNWPVVGVAAVRGVVRDHVGGAGAIGDGRREGDVLPAGGASRPRRSPSPSRAPVRDQRLPTCMPVLPGAPVEADAPHDTGDVEPGTSCRARPAECQWTSATAGTAVVREEGHARVRGLGGEAPRRGPASGLPARSRAPDTVAVKVEPLASGAPGRNVAVRDAAS